MAIIKCREYLKLNIGKDKGVYKWWQKGEVRNEVWMITEKRGWREPETKYKVIYLGKIRRRYKSSKDNMTRKICRYNW